MSVATKTMSPRAFVEGATIEDLAEAMMHGRDPFGFLVISGLAYFICTECHTTSSHGSGTATISDQWHWKCQDRRCRHTGTRYALERIVLESSELLDALYVLSGDDAS